jgi:hypothetical protein
MVVLDMSVGIGRFYSRCLVGNSITLTVANQCVAGLGPVAHTSGIVSNISQLENPSLGDKQAIFATSSARIEDVGMIGFRHEPLLEYPVGRVRDWIDFECRPGRRMDVSRRGNEA